MSNQQWNSGQGSNEWASQQPTREWTEQPQPQTSAQEWGQQPVQEWGQAQQPAQEWGQAQQPAQEWGQTQQPAQGWGQPQPQTSAQDWGQAQQPAQGWGQQQPQDWNQQQWQGQQPAQTFQPQFRAPVEPKGSPLDFSFQKLSLPSSASLIFLLGVVAVGVEWLFGFISLLTSGGEFYVVGAMPILNSLLGGLASALFKVLVLRVLIEIGVVGAKLLKKSEEEPAEKAEAATEEKADEAQLG